MIENYIKKSVQLEQLDCCIISFGGCGTHYLVNHLEKKKLKIKTNIWSNYLCHYSNLIELPIPIIYLYRDIRKAFISQLRNNFANKNYEMLNTISKRKYSDEHFFIAMYEQFEKFITADNIYKIEYNELFSKDKMTNLYQFLKIKNDSFESLFIQPKTFKFNNYQNIFDKHQDKINYVNSFVLKANDILFDLDKEGATK